MASALMPLRITPKPAIGDFAKVLIGRIGARSTCGIPDTWARASGTRESDTKILVTANNSKLAGGRTAMSGCPAPIAARYTRL